ncbi:hypothetical protein ACIOHC_02245 [Streptomyces sp. NPDC088252]|uniref:hypothetical protein n=1 Tax=unclassified Streptomyces TaxID=2593676 RepID=UPI003426E138
MEYGKHQAPARYEAGEGCPTTLIRIPVRIVVLVIVLPVWLVRDALVAGARAADRVLLRPLGRAVSRLFRTAVLIPAAWLYGAVLTPLGRALLWLAAAGPRAAVGRALAACAGIGGAPRARGAGGVAVRGGAHPDRSRAAPGVPGVARPGRAGDRRRGRPGAHRRAGPWPAVGLWRYVLTPLALAASRLVEHLLVRPSVWTYRHLLTPLGHGISRLLEGTARAIAALGSGLWAAVVWLVLTLIVAPLGWLYRRVLALVGREVAAAFGVARRIAGFISRAVGRAVAWLAWHLVGAPVTWVWRTVCTPVGHFVRDAVWAPAGRAAVGTGRAVRAALRSARETVAQARRDVRRTLVGGPGAPEPREPGSPLARTLGVTQQPTTVPCAAPEPEISSLGEKNAERG